MNTDLFPNTEKTMETALNKAFRYLSYRFKTIFEMKTYLKRKGFDQETIFSAIAYLKDKNYLNDKRYCKEYLEYQVKYKPKSKFGFRYDLKRKGISETIIDDALQSYEDEDLAFAAVKKRSRTWQNFDEKAIKQKAINYLRYRGFDYHTCKLTLSKFLKDRGNHED